MLYDKIGKAKNDDRPQYGFHGVAGQFGKVSLEILRRPLHVTYQRGPDILQAPTSHHSIIARDKESRQHSHIADDRPSVAT